MHKTASPHRRFTPQSDAATPPLLPSQMKSYKGAYVFDPRATAAAIYFMRIESTWRDLDFSSLYPSIALSAGARAYFQKPPPVLETPIYKLVSETRGLEPVLKRLIEVDSRTISERCGARGETALYRAIKIGQWSYASLLVEASDPEFLIATQNTSGRSLFWALAKRPNPELAKRIIARIEGYYTLGAKETIKTLLNTRTQCHCHAQLASGLTPTQCVFFGLETTAEARETFALFARYGGNLVIPLTTCDPERKVLSGIAYQGGATLGYEFMEKVADFIPLASLRHENRESVLSCAARSGDGAHTKEYLELLCKRSVINDPQATLDIIKECSQVYLSPTAVQSLGALKTRCLAALNPREKVEEKFFEILRTNCAALEKIEAALRARATPDDVAAARSAISDLQAKTAALRDEIRKGVPAPGSEPSAAPEPEKKESGPTFVRSSGIYTVPYKSNDLDSNNEPPPLEEDIEPVLDRVEAEPHNPVPSPSAELPSATLAAPAAAPQESGPIGIEKNSVVGRFIESYSHSHNYSWASSASTGHFWVSAANYDLIMRHPGLQDFLDT